MDVFDINGFICVQIEITRRCNMNCRYCYVVPRAYSEPELSIEEYYAIIKEIKEVLADKCLVFHFAGGELFLKKGVAGLLEMLLEENTTISIVSNGLDVPEEIFTKTLFKRSAGLFNFQISIDGLKGGHEAIRLDYERVLGNFRKLMENNVWTIVRTTLHQGNIDEIQDFYRFMDELGEEYNRVIEVDVQPVAECCDGLRHNLRDLSLSIEEYLEAGFTVDEMVRTSLPRIASSWRFVHDVASMLEEKDKLSPNSACYGCGGGFGIGFCANGDVVNCEMDVPFLNIRDEIGRESIRNVIETLKESNRPRKRCLHCNLNTICGMCRLAPVLHGYTAGFGYDDCVTFMDQVRRIHIREKNSATLAIDTASS